MPQLFFPPPRKVFASPRIERGPFDKKSNDFLVAVGHILVILSCKC